MDSVVGQASYRVVCIGCGQEVPETDRVAAFGHEECRREGYVSNLTTEFDLAELAGATYDELLSDRPGLWKYEKLLPVAHRRNQLSIGEGGTSLVHLARTGERMGAANLYAKNESQNPTWSQKDRLAAVAVSKALELGAKAITVSSTGNHAAATAAYAARAGLPCIVFTVASVPETMKVLMQAYGAIVVAMNSAEERWALMRQGIEQHGWFPTGNTTNPPVGSVYYGLEGYKTIAFELYEQFGRKLPDVVLVPTSYGDIIYGIWKGFAELKALGITAAVPRMVAVEPLGPLTKAVEDELDFPSTVPSRATPSFSTAAPASTLQALYAIRESGGGAVTVLDDDAILRDQLQLAQSEGLYVEAASVTSITALPQLLASGAVKPHETVVALLTSTGLKDPQTTRTQLPEVPVLAKPDMGELRASVRKRYGLELPE